jgi:hypothetical protein
MTYSPTYTDTDIAPAASNAVVTFIIVVGSFAALIALAVLWKFGKKAVK